MWQEIQAKLLKDEIEELLVPLSDIDDLYNLVKESLTQSRRGLAANITHDRPWPLLPLIVCEAICGYYKQAIPIAAALQLLMAAGDVFDDIEDADSSESLSARYGSAVATNVATTLLILAERAITLLKEKGVADYAIVRIMNSVNSFYTTTCTGQHLDLSFGSDIAISEDTYLKIISMKSASQVKCACHVGALLATDNQELIDLFTMFGHNLGMAAQITNDIQGVIHGSDITKHNITLPVIYALTQANDEVRNQLELTFGSPSELVPDPAQIRNLLFSIGAMHYATIKLEFYRQRAHDILSKIKGARNIMERLKLFLE
jgi:geranylgeranyl pyrophosphate synthase